MGTEIERKFLVADDRWRPLARSTQKMRQGYLCVGPPTAIRVRITGDKAHLNVKKATLDVVRSEFEYPIPLDDAEAMLAHLCEGHPVEKTRYVVPYGGLTWEIDEFEGVNQGLVVAEVELEDENQAFEKPSWVGSEVSGDPRYLNSSLSQLPYSLWPRGEAPGRTSRRQ